MSSYLFTTWYNICDITVSFYRNNFDVKNREYRFNNGKGKNPPTNTLNHDVKVRPVLLHLYWRLRTDSGTCSSLGNSCKHNMKTKPCWIQSFSFTERGAKNEGKKEV